MDRGYISFEDMEKIVGRENMIRFCELMKEKFEQTDEKERIKIEFIEHLLYEDYEYQFENGGEIPKTFDNLLVLEDAVGTKLFGVLLDKYRTKRVSVSYGLVRRKLICNDLTNGMGIKEIAEKYNVDTATVYRYRNKIAKWG